MSVAGTKRKPELSQAEKADLYDFLKEIDSFALCAIAYRYKAACSIEFDADEALTAARNAHLSGELPNRIYSAPVSPTDTKSPTVPRSS